MDDAVPGAMPGSTGLWSSFDSFMPHGHCYLWRPDILWLHAISDSLTAFAYYSIPAALLYFVVKRRDLEFPWMFVMFGIFIMACGTTHLMGVWTIWNPDYVADGAIKAVTAVASLTTAFLLWPLIPKALMLASPRQLRAVNDQLSQEVAQRRQAEQALRGINEELERRVQERTESLEQTNQFLRREIAEREHVQQELRKLNEDLEQRVAQRTASLEAAVGELEAFSYSVSHDLRAPLRAMDGFSTALLDRYSSEMDARGQDYLNRIRAASQRMGQLIEDLLALSRVARQEMTWQPVDLSHLAREILEDMARDDPSRQVTVAVSPGLRTEGDPRLLAIVLQNLLGNAWKFTSKRPDAAIRVDAEDTPQGRVFRISDNGAGFDMRYAEKLFGAFQRLHRQDEFEGTGIGLATVQRIIHRHGGRVWAESAPGEGSTFFFTIGSNLTV